jgi:hypothetical protein
MRVNIAWILLTLGFVCAAALVWAAFVMSQDLIVHVIAVALALLIGFLGKIAADETVNQSAPRR